MSETPHCGVFNFPEVSRLRGEQAGGMSQQRWAGRGVDARGHWKKNLRLFGLVLKLFSYSSPLGRPSAGSGNNTCCERAKRGHKGLWLVLCMWKPWTGSLALLGSQALSTKKVKTQPQSQPHRLESPHKSHGAPQCLCHGCH